MDPDENPRNTLLMKWREAKRRESHPVFCALPDGMQSQLEATQSELESAKRAADQAKEQVAELKQTTASLNSELQKSDGQRIELQEKLDAAGSEIERLKSELDQALRAESP